MIAWYHPRRLLNRAQLYRPSLLSCTDAESALGLSKIPLSSRRPLSFSPRNDATPQSYQPTRMPASYKSDFTGAKPAELRNTPARQTAEKAQRSKANYEKQLEEARKIAERQGTLANNSLFADEDLKDEVVKVEDGKEKIQSKDRPSLSRRSAKNMAQALTPNPNARLRWQRKMVIRDVRRSGRLTKEMRVSRTERSHLAKSHFFKTSMKKLAPLARQIAGKSIDEAILQMRFSVKKAARDVRKHLMQARDEAIVMRGMGLRPRVSESGESQTASMIADPAIGSSQYPTSPEEPDLIHSHFADDPAIVPRPSPAVQSLASEPRRPRATDMYIAQAWVNRGPYGRELEPRARGRTNILRPPHTGISVLLKEEKTRIREKAEQEAKAIRKRLGKNMWTQLPDRPVTRQSQYILW